MREQQQQRWVEIDNSEAEHVFKEAEGRLAELSYARVDARAWIKNELDLNAELADAWSRDMKATTRCAAPVRSSINRSTNLRSSAAGKMSGSQRYRSSKIAKLVTQAMRGSGRAPPPERPLRLGKVSDDDLKTHTKEKYGYTPNF